MTWLTILGFAADIAIVSEYALFTFNRSKARWRHAANAFGCFPIIAAEIIGHAWVPLPLTAFFGTLGWIGLLRANRT